MNIQDKLNELRKIVGQKTSSENSANADLSKMRQEDKSESDASNNVIKPIDIPCKNYTDENGHFAYIDVYIFLQKPILQTFENKEYPVQ